MRQLAEFFDVDHQIIVTRNRNVAVNGGATIDGNEDVDSLLVSEPPLCQECIALKRQQELSDKLVRMILVPSPQQIQNTAVPTEMAN